MNFDHDSGVVSSLLVIDTSVAPPTGGANVLQIIGTGGIVLPSGSESQRPVGAPSGTIRMNTDIGKVETLDNGGDWIANSSGTVTGITVESANTALVVTNGTVSTSGTITLSVSGELLSLANINPLAEGPVVRQADGSYVARSLTAGDGIVITNGDGLAGNPLIAVSADLDAIDTLATNGFVFRAGDASFGTKTFAASGDITLSEVNNVLTFGYTASGDLAALAAMTGTGITTRTSTGTLTYATRAIEGTTGTVVVSNGDLVAANAQITLATVTQGTIGNFQKVAVDTFGRVTATEAVNATDITALVNSVYVNVAGDTMSGELAMGNNKITGLADALAGTDAVNLNVLQAYINGLSWKAAVRAGTTDNVILAITTVVDGVTLVTGDRVLVKDQTVKVENGIYTFNGTGLVRAADQDQANEFSSAAVLIKEGTLQKDTGWNQTAEVVTVGNDDVVYVQFMGAATFVAGVGLDLTGNTFSVNMGAGIIQLPSDEVGLDVRADSALFLTEDGTTSSVGTSAKLAVRTGAGLTQNNTNGIFVDAGAVTNTMLANSVVTLTGTSGSDAVALGESVAFVGATAPVTVAVTDNNVAIAVADATTTTKGLASFNTNQFAVTAGVVDLAADFEDLVNVDMTTVAKANGDLITWNAVAGKWVPISQNAVAPDLVLDDLTDVTINTPVAGNLVKFNGTAWVNVDLAGAGVQPADAGLTSLAGMVTTGIVVSSAADTFATRALVAGTGISISGDVTTGDLTLANTGVTSVGLALPTIFSVTGSPVTTTGDLTATLATQAASIVFAGPGSGADAAPTFRSLTYTDLPIKLVVENRSSEVAPTATGANAVAVGSAAAATHVGEFAHASGQFAAAGDAQSFEMVLRNSTTDATATELFLDGSSARAVLSNNTAWTFTVQVIGLKADGTAAAGYRFDGVALRAGSAAATSFIGTPSKNILGETSAAWDAEVLADATNGSVGVRVTGAIATDIRWVATIRGTQAAF